jgi:shikimate dehydrogenase
MNKPMRFALIGHPVDHSASPAMHRAAFRKLGLPHSYEAIDCGWENQVATAVNLLKRGAFSGLNITIPYKKKIVEFIDVVEEQAQATGAVNTLVRKPDGKIHGYNTDIDALADEIRARGSRFTCAMIIGSGGAAAAALGACKQLGVRVVGMTSRSWATSELVYDLENATHFRTMGALTLPWPGLRDEQAPTVSNLSSAMHLQWADMAAMADVVIQATSAGLSPKNPGDEVADIIPWLRLPAHTIAIDVVYSSRDTPFVAKAKARGLVAATGEGMLVRQGARAFELWLGIPAPMEEMHQAVSDHLGRRLDPWR